VSVVSVGNLCFGGTGKTPTTVALVRDLVQRGRRPAVLSRGYGRSTRDPMIVVGPDPRVSPERAGDEPLEMAQRLPGVPVVVDGDRVRGARIAIANGADVLVLDDGFQHLRLARDLDLVLLDANDPWAGSRLPPRGRLREPLSALSRATAVLVTKLSGDEEAGLGHIREAVAEIAPGVPVLGSRMRALRVLKDGSWCGAEVLDGARVLAFAGIARPQGFVSLLEAAGANVVESRWRADHHPWDAVEVEEIVAASAAAGAVAVTTAKDAVKLPQGVKAWVVEVEVVPTAGSWDSLWELTPGVLQ
jgi:tetraacyldisaccharide 4'-kinase